MPAQLAAVCAAICHCPCRSLLRMHGSAAGWRGRPHRQRQDDAADGAVPPAGARGRPRAGGRRGHCRAATQGGGPASLREANLTAACLLCGCSPVCAPLRRANATFSPGAAVHLHNPPRARHVQGAATRAKGVPRAYIHWPHISARCHRAPSHPTSGHGALKPGPLWRGVGQ